jgi:hypothetical protein
MTWRAISAGSSAPADIMLAWLVQLGTLSRTLMGGLPPFDVCRILIGTEGLYDMDIPESSPW